MWALETLNGPRLVAALIESHPPSSSPPSSLNEAARRQGSWRVEITLEWLPYTHTVAVTPLRADSTGTAVRSWANLMLSLKDDLPPLLSVSMASVGNNPSPRLNTSAQSGVFKSLVAEGRDTGCWYGGAAIGRFLYGCDGNMDGTGGSVLVPRGGPDGEDVERCGLVYSELAAAVADCSRRGTCGGITLVPGWGFELRSSVAMGG